jgi:hypothetical protein
MRIHIGRKIEINAIAWFVTVFFVLLSGFISYCEGTFTSNGDQSQMGFINHGGMWSDLLLMPFINALLVPCFSRPNRKMLTFFIASIIIAGIVTVFLHIHWMGQHYDQYFFSHMFYIHPGEAWYQNITLAGWMHIVFMTIQLALLAMYTIFPMPSPVVWALSVIITLHIPIAVIQPGWYFTKKFWTMRNLLPAAILFVLTWLIAIAKLSKKRTGLLKGSGS